MRWTRVENFVGNPNRRKTILSLQRKRFSSWSFLSAAGMVIVSVNLISSATNKQRALATTGITLNFVAHQDDDLLFLNPDLLHAIQAGRTVRTVFLTAGDAGKGTAYWQGREIGAQAAYAEMCGVANVWTQTDAGIADHPIPVFTLSVCPTVSLAFMRLPDGTFDGFGFSAHNYESLRKLWNDKISTVRAIDGSSSYSKATLINTLTGLMSSFQPEQINTQNYVDAYGDGDHSDHHSVAYFVQAAAQHYTTPHCLTGYEHYNTSLLSANVTGADLTAKQKAFYAYIQHDAPVRESASSSYEEWLRRQYTVGSGGWHVRWRNHMPGRLARRLISKWYRTYRHWSSMRNEL